MDILEFIDFNITWADLVPTPTPHDSPESQAATPDLTKASSSAPSEAEAAAAAAAATGAADENIPIRRGLLSKDLYHHLTLLFPALWMVFLPMGLFANALNIRTFLRMRLQDCVTISFFVLAVSDFLHLLFPLVNVASLTLLYLEEVHGWYFRVQPMALFVYVMNWASVFNNWTSLITAFLAAQRCLCIVWPLRFKSVVTRVRTWYAMAGMAAVSIAPGLAYIFGSYWIRLLPSPAWPNRTQYGLVVTPVQPLVKRYLDRILFMFLNVACQLLACGCLAVMAYTLAASVRFRRDLAATTTTTTNTNSTTTTMGGPSWSKGCLGQGVATTAASAGKNGRGGEEGDARVDDDNRDNNNNKQQQQQSSKERTAILQVALLTAIYVATNTPKFVLALASILAVEFRFGGLYTNVYVYCINFRLTLDYLNSAVNFFIYYRYNSKFRKLCFAKSSGDSRKMVN